MKIGLLIDVSCLCYRAHYGMPNDLSHNGEPTNILFGFFEQLIGLQDVLNSTLPIFCFDHGKNLRKKVYPEYKAHRKKDRTEDDLAGLRSLRKQISLLRTKYLREIGYRNIFWQNGYESDDIIASICENSIPKGCKMVIVSRDEDFYQLLSEGRVSMYNPNTMKRITEKQFSKRYGIGASMWGDVKALGGCKSDNIKGMTGIGEKLAISFLTGNMNPETPTHKRIIEERDLWEENLKLVRLPYEGTETFTLKKDKTTNDKWGSVMTSLGMVSLKQGRIFRR